jgi:hypothetical protein
MDDHHYRQFFLDPQQPVQRHYEIARAFFVERQPMPAIARRFGFAYGTIRNLVSQFRAQFQGGGVPPFSLPRHADGPSARAMTPWLAP